jgi:cysteine desulfurase/selenocysteine lyase
MSATTATPFDAERVRAAFPLLQRTVHGKSLVYLDSGASAPMPLPVIAAVDHYERYTHSNVHRGVHRLSQEATEAYEGAREHVRRFVNARSSREVVFTRGTTEAINLVSQSWGRSQLHAGDEVLITHLEHHANIVPWQLACRATGARLLAAPLTSRGEVDMERFRALIGPRTRLIAVAHVSNALGTVLPLAEIGALAHARGIPWLVDGAQAVAHERIDVQALGCDFYAFSGHKMYGPTGIGVLVGRETLLQSMPPWQGGGDMIRTVSIEQSEWNDLPWKFEAGTPPIASAVGLGAAVQFIESLDRPAMAAHEQALRQSAEAALCAIPGVRIVGTAANKGPVISFTVDGVHPHDIGTIVDLEGVAIRTGHHCAMPVMEFFGLPATARATLACFNTAGDVQRLAAAVRKVREVFA